MKIIIGLILIVGGIVFGLWAGVWWAFIGGIVNVIEAVRAPDLVAMNVAIGVAKMIFTPLIFWVAAATLMLPGYALAKSA